MEGLEFYTPLETGAIDTHEMFLAYKSAGFTPDEALTLIGILLLDTDQKSSELEVEFQHAYSQFE